MSSLPVPEKVVSPLPVALIPSVIVALASIFVLTVLPPSEGISIPLAKKNIMALFEEDIMQDNAFSPQDPCIPPYFVSGTLIRHKPLQVPKGVVQCDS